MKNFSKEEIAQADETKILRILNEISEIGQQNLWVALSKSHPELITWIRDWQASCNLDSKE